MTSTQHNAASCFRNEIPISANLVSRADRRGRCTDRLANAAEARHTRPRAERQEGKRGRGVLQRVCTSSAGGGVVPSGRVPKAGCQGLLRGLRTEGQEADRTPCGRDTVRPAADARTRSPCPSSCVHSRSPPDASVRYTAGCPHCLDEKATLR